MTDHATRAVRYYPDPEAPGLYCLEVRGVTNAWGKSRDEVRALAKSWRMQIRDGRA